MMLRSSAPFLCFALVFAALGCERRLVDVFELRRDLAGERTIELDHAAGDVQVIGEPGSTEVFLVGELRTLRSVAHDESALRAVRFEVERIDDTTARILAGLDHGPEGYEIDLIAHVPAETTLVIDDGSGDLRVHEVAGLDLRDGSGDVHVSDIAGGIVVEDGSGDLRIDRVGEDVHVHDGSGDIVIRHVGRDVSIEDGSGDIFVDDADDVEILEAGSGDVEIR